MSPLKVSTDPVLVQETASNVNDLEGELAGASGSMTELMTAFSTLNKRPRYCSTLAKRVTPLPMVETLKATLHGIDKIKGASETAFDVINGPMIPPPRLGILSR